MAIHDGVVNEMKSKPYSMLMLLGLYVVVSFMWTSRSDYAMAGDLAVLQNQVAAIGADVKRGNLETQLRNINTELFAIQQKISDLRAANKPIDIIYYDRASALQNDKERLTRELAGVK